MTVPAPLPDGPAITGAARPTRRRDIAPPKTGAGEAEVLRGFLDYLRTSVAAKVDGLSEEDARRPGVPSGTNLLGLVHHLTHVERSTFLGEHVTSWPKTFGAPATDSSAEVVAAYRDAINRANRAIDARTDLSGALPHPRAGRSGPSLRWALTHMIEETARHAGHADILREQIDGRTGR